MATKYKHYSFDLWLTLIKSNPLYKQQRSNYFFEHFNPKKKTQEEVFLIIREIEKMVDVVNQTTGYSIHCTEIAAMILHQLEYDCSNLGIKDMVAVMHLLQQQFLDCPPSLYDKDTAAVLRYIHAEGNTINILSNTAFIIGDTLEKLLEMLGIKQYISFSIYSDLCGLSKPNPAIFSILTDAVFPKASISEILHVGDNAIADIAGAKAYGIDALQINTNSKTIKDIFK